MFVVHTRSNAYRPRASDSPTAGTTSSGAAASKSLILPTRRLVLYYAISVLLIFAAYAPTLTFYVAGGDNFDEIWVARFVDSEHPQAIFTMPITQNRYRPLDRLANFVTYQAAGFDPFAFRLRNLCAHLVAAALFGLLFGAVTNRRQLGPLAALLFGIYPGNNLPVVFAITTKTLFGICFLLTCFVWWRVWRTRRATTGNWALLLLLSLLTIAFHEQGLALLGVAVLVCSLLSRIDRQQWRRWVIFGVSLVAVTLVMYVGTRAAAGLSPGAPLGSVSSTLKYSAASAVSLLTPVDFFLLFGKGVVTNTQSSIPALATPGRYLLPVGVLLGGLLTTLGLIVWSVIYRLRTRDSKGVHSIGFFACGAVLTLLPVLPFIITAYSEVYNYMPSAFVLAGLLYMLLPSLYIQPPTFLRRYSVALLGLVVVSYGAATLYRNATLGEVAGQTRTVVQDIVRLVPNPSPNSRFILVNQPGLATDVGYSIYGFQGAGTLEDAVPTALGLIYNRRDVSGVLVRDRTTLSLECSRAKSEQHTYVLEWSNGNLHLLEGACQARIRSISVI